MASYSSSENDSDYYYDLDDAEKFVRVRNGKWSKGSEYVITEYEVEKKRKFLGGSKKKKRYYEAYKITKERFPVKGNPIQKGFKYRICIDDDYYYPADYFYDLMSKGSSLESLKGKSEQESKDSLTPVRYVVYGKDGIAEEEVSKLDESVADPPLSPVVHINMPEETFSGGGRMKKGDLALSNVGDAFTVRFPDGTYWIANSNSGKWEKLRVDSFYFFGDKSSEMTEKKQQEKIIEEIKLQLAETKAELASSRQALQDALSHSQMLNPDKVFDILTYPDPVESDGKELKTDYAQIVGMRAVGSISKFSTALYPKRSDARAWLISALTELNFLGISRSIVYKVVVSRMEPVEKNCMTEMIQNGEINSVDSFVDAFLHRFGNKSSAIMELRRVILTNMSSEDIAEKNYVKFGNEIMLTAHSAYKELKIAHQYWDILDTVLCVNSFLYAIPRWIARKLLEHGDSLTFQDCMQKAAVVARTNDFARSEKSTVMMVNSRGQGKAKPDFNKNKGACKRCQKQKDRKTPCNHCFTCYSSDHLRQNCPKAKEAKQVASSETATPDEN